MKRFTGEDIKSVVLQIVSGVASAIIAAWLLNFIFADELIVLIICIIFAISMVWLAGYLMHRYTFYKSIIDVLQNSDVSMHETIAYYCRRVHHKKWRNIFHINSMSITYKIQNYDHEKNRADVAITYNACAVNDTGREFKAIYQCLLQNERYDIANTFSMNNETHRPMERINDLHIHLAALTKSIKKNESFFYEIRNYQKHGFSFDGSCSFIIDPLNYSTAVQDVTISIDCPDKGLWKWIKNNYRVYLKTSETDTHVLIDDSGIELILDNGITNMPLEHLLLSNLYFKKNPGILSAPPIQQSVQATNTDVGVGSTYSL